MSHRSPFMLLLLCCLGFFFGLLSLRIDLAFAQARGRAIAVIVKPGFGAHDISLAMLRRVFGGETTDYGGARLIPFNYGPENPVRRAFDKTVLDMNPSQVGPYWINRRIRGQGLPPRTVPTPRIMRAIAAKNMGAIGYILADELDSRVMALTVEGKRVDAPDYPIRVH